VSDRVEPSRNLSDKRKAAFAVNVANRRTSRQNRHAFSFYKLRQQTRTSTSKTVVQNLHRFRRVQYATCSMCSEGMIFRDKGFCKAEVASKIDLIGNRHR
jgi:hypothetical protein